MQNNFYCKKTFINLYDRPSRNSKIGSQILYGESFKILKKEKNFVKIFKSYLNCKYKWGGKTYDGIDCSALIQIFYKFNNKFFPRDTVEQIKYKKGNITKKKFKLGDIIYWKGHVAVCINSKELIHAYGPKKKSYCYAN